MEWRWHSKTHLYFLIQFNYNINVKIPEIAAEICRREIVNEIQHKYWIDFFIILFYEFY